MLTITQSVGVKGKNLKHDVLKIQQSLNKINPPIAKALLKEDGLYGPITGKAISNFQTKHVFLMNPDGRVDPDGKTIQKLASMLIQNIAPQKLLFPLKTKQIGRASCRERVEDRV